MSDNIRNPQTLEEAINPEGEKRVNWAGFVEGDVVAFFDAHELEKLSLEDGNGNKAKLQRTKGNSIKIEYTSSVVL
ncbi:hypothetical protein ACH6CV_06860 [Bacillota bacterium Meth-B3]|nr:hypothetical protein [Christensenellaceae bacterium]MEA5069007.1 hypothetical protein [Christensenellaceae bacterium]